MAEMTSSSSLLVAVATAWGNLSGMARMSLIGGFIDISFMFYFYDTLCAVVRARAATCVQAFAYRPADTVEGDQLDDVIKKQSGAVQVDN